MAIAVESLGKYMTPSPLSINKDVKLVDAMRLMRQHAIRHLPVVDGAQVVGILSERDIHFARSLRTVDPQGLRVEDAMTPNPVTYPPEAPLREVAFLMANSRAGSAVIIDKGRLVGIFTTVDALRVLAVLLIQLEGHRKTDAANDKR